MPGARSRVKPLSAGDSSGSSASDEVSQLELHLQRQLEEDVARIFDESIYSDLEVVCGKLKILTHSCILKARTHKFYHKLEAILHVNIGRNTFDEIYSFISDVYTECNIQHQEKEIIDYLNENLNLVKNVIVKNSPKNKQEEKVDPDVYSTPNCVSPEEKSFQKVLSSSPSTDLTKEYYALVPIDENILDKELIEQDALSNAFQSINKSQTDDINEIQNKQCVKPTSLFLSSSHIPKINKHSNSCDILRDSDLKSTDLINKVNDFDAKIVSNKISQRKSIKKSDIDKSVDILYKNSNLSETTVEKVLDPTYSPDSLITDEPSSSSDYLSAAYAVSPAASTSGISQLNVGDSATKMENIITISDSGLETIGMLESLNSHKEVTLTDMSLTESTFQDMINDDANCLESASNTLDKNHIQKLIRSTSLHSPSSSTSTEKDLHERRSNKLSLTEMSGTSTKEEKQRQNEEIVILESSSLSSETGSWESVFPPKLPERDLCEKFITSERQSVLETDIRSKSPESAYIHTDTHNELCPSLVQKSPFKSTSCFIDAASLADEGDDVITVNTERNESQATGTSDNALPEASRPVPCAFKRDLSPNDLSESNDNEDSLEQAENKDPDSIHKDMSPTIFEMKPIIEDSMCAKTFENAAKAVQRDPKPAIDSCTDTKNPGLQYPKFFPVDMSTPNNSIIYVGIPGFKVYKSEEIESVVTVTGSETNSHHLNRFEEISNTVPRGVFVEEYNRLKNNNDLPIVSGGVSVEDHLPQLGSSHSGSPSTNRKKENLPIVSGAYIPEVEEEPEKPPKAPSNASAWVVDMSSSPKSDVSECSVKQNKKVLDKTFTILRSASKSTNSVENCKSRSSVDSDSSEKSTHKFYIDLSTLPDALAPDLKHEGDDSNEKKNIFSMFIDLGDKSATVKEMPARLSSSFNNTRKTVKTETKCTNSKGTKTPKVSCLTSVVNHAEDNIMFEKLESLCDDPNLSILDIISNPGSHTDDINELSSSMKDNEVLSKAIEGEPTQDDSFDLFVKLSDLDKPKIDMTYDVKKESIERMTRSIPDNDWRESNQTINSRSIDIISSFHSENALSLNRLFPHLKNDFSRSMPGSLLSRTMSPLRIGVSSSPQILDIDEHASDISEMSSVQSSYCRSVVENSTTEETSQTSSLISNCQSRLGQDLLRMFLEEIAPDVIVEVSGRRIKAHKCILSSRCQYFAGILSGGWVESAGNVIALPPFSFSVVHFALCHIYSGVSMIPDSISIVELATIADMLGLEGLKEAIMFTLKAKYCHHFHKPCAVCTAGVLECFTLSSVYGLDDLYRKCLRWITKHFHKVWPTKAFATLPTELLEKCYQEHIVNLTTENIVETVYGCGITEASLQNSRWSETVARMCQRLVNAAAHFAAPRLTAVLRAAAQTPAAPPAPPPPAMQALDDCMAAAIEWAPPDEACRAYAFLSVLVREIRVQHSEKPDLIYTGGVLGSPAGSWRLQCEDALVRAAPRVVGTHAFKELPPELRKRLRELGCIMFGAQAAAPAAAGAGAGASPQTARKTRSAGAGRRPAACARSLDFDQVRASFVPYAPKPQPPAGATELAHPLARPAKTFPPRVRSLDVNQVRASFVPYAAKPQPPAGATELPPPLQQLARPAKTFPPRVRTTKAQEERTKYNLIKTAQSQRTKYNVIKTAHSQKQPSSKTAPAVRAAYEHAKPRHLEPRPLKDERKPLKKPQPKMVSSSESSRNLSPVQAHGAGGARGGRTGAHVSRDSLAPASRPRTADTSTNSLSESHNSNKYATYTKARHTHKGSIESVTTRPPAKCHSITTAITKVKTKIPVYLNQGSKLCTPVSANSRDAQRSMQEKSVASNLSLTMPRNKPSGSLMNATKSSQAKMVLKQVKETQNKNSSKHDKPCKDKNASRSPPPNEIPVMKRSGTFSKEEPMFGEKATDIDFNK